MKSVDGWAGLGPRVGISLGFEWEILKVSVALTFREIKWELAHGMAGQMLKYPWNMEVS